MLIFRDVTAHRQRERERQHDLFTARQLASIVESSEVAIIGKGLDGVVQNWNTAAERLFGYTEEQAVGRHISLVIPPERLAEEDEIIATLKAGRRIEHFETERVRADGGRVQVSLTVSPIKDDDGNVIGASKIVRDITRERQAEDNYAVSPHSCPNRTDGRTNSWRRSRTSCAIRSRRSRNALEILEARRRPPSMLRGARTRWSGSSARWCGWSTICWTSTASPQQARAAQDRASSSPTVVDARRRSRAGRCANAHGHELTVELPDEPCYLDADAARLAQVFEPAEQRCQVHGARRPDLR